MSDPNLSESVPALTKAQLPDVIQRYLKGESVQTLAAEAGTCYKTIYNWMLGGLGDKDYGNTVTECLVNRIADSDEELDKAQNMLQVTRAMHKARFSRMDLERRRPQLYGPKQEIQTDSKITIVVQRDRGLQVVGSQKAEGIQEAEVVENNDKSM